MKGELKMIPLWHQLPAVIEAPEEARAATANPQPARKKRDRAIRRLHIIISALAALCVIQWVAIYLMLPGVF